MIRFTLIIVLISQLSFAQDDLGKLLKRLNKENIPYISHQELLKIKDSVVLLDAREFNEYKISHIKNAYYAGHKNCDVDSIQKIIPNKNTTIVVYCSLGVRSEDIAEKLKKEGYNNIFNLYGGVFEWKNNNLPLYNSNNKKTDSIHAFSNAWSKWIKKGIKVYD